ncbi:MAG: helicase-related protein, partial [Actinomycetota bacterium]|nr:helicase-related protein [Actinomycetota bacterium]
KALVATSALGMGFDKGDLAFCVHLGLPPSPVSYYQQIGRAGRAIERAEVIALPRAEDQAIWRWFESVSLPSEQQCDEVLQLLSARRPMSLPRLESSVNLSRTRLGTLLDILDVQGAIARAKGGWLLADTQWSYDAELAERLSQLRRDESSQMLEWANGSDCRLQYLRDRLDDADTSPCGRCDVCTDRTWPGVDPAAAARAPDHLRGGDIGIEPRRQWPTGLDEPKGRIAPGRQASLGRALARSGDGGWDQLVDQLITSEAASKDQLDEVVGGLVGVLKRWQWATRPTWICPMPSRRHSTALDAVCTALGAIGKLPVHHALTWNDPAGQAGFQVEQANSAHQVSNIWGRLELDQAAMPPRPVSDGPVLLVDDSTQSRWTLTVAAFLLTAADGGPVLPFVLRQS